jgi:catechol 2,3-dioxygenase-like lactoylglutathione lyase family enzyme
MSLRALPGARTTVRALREVLEQEVAALPEVFGPDALRGDELREEVAKGHYFKSWAAAMAAGDTLVDPRFESAADAIVDGDAATLRRLLADDLGLARARSPFGHHQTLLQHVSANGIEATRQWQSPPNAVEMAEILLAAGAEPDVTCDSYGDGSTALTLLVSSVHPYAAGVQADLVEALVRGGANADGIDAYATPLWTAAAFGYSDASARLARCGARVDNVILAAAVGDLGRVKSFFAEDGMGDLLPQTAPSASRIGGWGPPLDAERALEHATIYASLHGRADVVDFLLSKHPNLQVTEPMWQNTALDAARHGKHAAIVARLVGAGPAKPARMLGLGWLGVRTPAADAMCALYRDVLGLEVIQEKPGATWFRTADGTEVHVYGAEDTDHDFFVSGPVVGFAVESFAAARAALVRAGIELLYPEPQRKDGRAWQHFRGPDGNVYEIIGPDDLA